VPQENRIRLLSDDVINKIAAGEVVERPASVLKELIENAIDASATHIDINIIAGGKTLIGVADNGTGMNRHDALLALERHATSKIFNINDLEHIATLGFRGEALAAISSVSRLRLITRIPDENFGTEIIMTGGKLHDVQDIGCPPGTTIEVRNLFFNVPARRKFLRSEATEFSHIKQVFFNYAFAHCKLALSLTVDNKNLYTLTADASLAERIETLYAIKSDEMKKVEYESAWLTISGFAALPQHSKADRYEQYIFINNRPATAPIINAAIREGYHGLLPRDRHPIVFIFIQIDPAAVDVNVHPTKREVRFRQPAEVRDALIEALHKALAHPFYSETRHAALSTKALPQNNYDKEKSFLKLNYQEFKHIAPQNNMKNIAAPPVEERFKKISPDDKIGIAGKKPWSWYRVLGRLAGFYVVLETDEGLTMMDPHAAHERVLYEKFMNQLAEEKIKVQQLLMPETLSVPPRTAMQIKKNMGLLRKMGFYLAEFGGDTFLIEGVPACFGNVQAGKLIEDLMVNIEEAGEKRGGRGIYEESIAKAACKAAVKATQSFSDEEISILIEELVKTELPYTCPHGRPTLIHISLREWNKRFGRE
jgi:DNA mismatch repair protein MutL